MQHKNIDCGTTTEPTVSQLVNRGQAKILLDMRTADGAHQALGGLYPATSLYKATDYVNKHKDIVQKLANVYVETLLWIQTHSPSEIADQILPDYYKGSGKDAYITALQNEKGIYSPDGVIPPDGPQTVLNVLSAFDENVKGHNIDLSKTYTTGFVKGAK